MCNLRKKKISAVSSIISKRGRPWRDTATRARREKAEKGRSEHCARSVQHVTYHSIYTSTKSTIADLVKLTILNLQPGDGSRPYNLMHAEVSPCLH